MSQTGGGPTGWSNSGPTGVVQRWSNGGGVHSQDRGTQSVHSWILGGACVCACVSDVYRLASQQQVFSQRIVFTVKP
eukprot:3575483-Alexandrium_andersonii.AAC.1